ncbi:MAG: glycosyltransferase family 39 protein [Polyangiaceae bacterium]
MTTDSAWTRRLASLSAVLAALRIVATKSIGYGDAEALYACYARHPQASYRDHPGLIGQLARLLGEGGTPAPSMAHAVSGALATLVPWMFLFAARALGASMARASIGAMAFALVPEICVGLFAMTPDLLLAPLWLLAIGCAAKAESAKEDRKNTWLFAAGFLAALSASAKVSGLLLLAALLLWRGYGEKRPRAIWVGAFGGLFPFAVVIDHEVRRGFPMLAHRFVSHEAGVGTSVTGALRSVGGQFAYLSPLFAILLVALLRPLWKARKESAHSELLMLAAFVPGIPLFLYGLMSPRAEPHWLAPAWISVGLFATRDTPALSGRVAIALLRPRVFVPSLILSGMLSLGVYGWVLSPEAQKLLPKNADRKLDITNELYGWPTAVDRVKELLRERQGTMVVGPHWIICAQLHAGLPADVPVGCAGTPADFEDWYPEAKWKDAPYILYVRDDRFPAPALERFPDRTVIREDRVRTFRGGLPARTFTLSLLGRNAGG